MKCPKCGFESQVEGIYCPKCGCCFASGNASQNIENSKHPMHRSWWFWVILAAVVVIVIGIVADPASEPSKDNIDSNNLIGEYNSTSTVSSAKVDSSSNTSYVAIPSDGSYGLNESFVFDELELSFGSNYSFDTLKNKYSELNGQSVVKLPVKVKNLSSKTHSLNMFYFDIFGSQGVELDDVAAYFDDCVNFAGELRPNASYSSYLYFPYDGDGTYVVEFDNWKEQVTLEFMVKKR